MMTAAVLCPGPSLALLTESPKEDLVVCVNRAILAHSAQVWAAMDYPMIRDHWQKVGKPKLLTRAQTWQDISHRCGLELATTSDAMRAFVPVRPGVAWTLYTAPCAIVYAALMGAQRINVYGADMAGEGGFTPDDKGENRSEARWASERVIFNALVEQLAERGVVVCRVQPST